MRIAIGADHAGFHLKNDLSTYIRRLGHQLVDVGTHSTEAVDYPDYAEAVCRSLYEGRAERGVLICGSGVGASVAANKIPGIRAGLCHDTFSAHQGVEHDNMNVLVLGGRVIGPELARELVGAYLKATFTGEERHLRRLQKVFALEERMRRTQLITRDHYEAVLFDINGVLASSGAEAYPGSVIFIKSLRLSGIRTAVVTSSQNCREVLRAARVEEFFDVLVDGNVLQEKGLEEKPAPDSLLKAAEMLRVLPGRAVVIEDDISGVKAGAAGGFGLVIGIARKNNADELKANGADIVVNDLSELIPALSAQPLEPAA